MADEAFALSPISARATQPSEADYDAIREAFMETSRGRWFLGEYAKRNRNADTRLVLDAVARIEETLAAQKKPSRDPLLDQALAAFRTALGDAKDATRAALQDLALEEHLGPVRKGARVIREIAWRLREIGADGRICDLIDSQVTAIEDATAKMAPGDLAAALSGAFDLIEARIAAFDAVDADLPAPSAAEASPPWERGGAGSGATDAGAEQAAAAVPLSTEPGAAVEANSAAPQVEAAARPQTTAFEGAAEVAEAGEAGATDAFTADDEAVLDRIALEMAAPDTDAAYEPPMEEMADHEMAKTPKSAAEASPPSASAPAVQDPVAAKKVEIPVEDIEIIFVGDVGETPAEPVAAQDAAAAPVHNDAPEAESVARATPIAATLPVQDAPEAEPALSLGSSLLANGIVQRPRSAKPDPLAPIRRMSQSERIAFFS